MLNLFEYNLNEIYDENPFDESIQISQSLMGQYFMCEGRVGYSFDPRYVDKPGEKTVYGTVAHAIVELDLDDKPLVLTTKKVSSLLTDALDKDGTSREELGISEEDEKDFVTEIIDWYAQWKTSTVRHNLAGNIVAMEQRKYLPLGFTDDGMPIVLAGTPDLIVKSNGGYTIKDLKTTSSNKWSTATATFSKQPDVYLALSHAEWDAQGFEFLVWLRHKQQWETYFTSRTEHDINVTLQQAFLIGMKIHNGVFVPNPIDSNSWTNKRAWYCGPKWCGAWDFCDFKELHDDKDINEPAYVGWK